MTYCVGLKINKGLVFMSDTRTNSGIDNISTFQKMHTWSKEGDRVITLLNAGNLATTQLVISLWMNDQRLLMIGARQYLKRNPCFKLHNWWERHVR